MQVLTQPEKVNIARKMVAAAYGYCPRRNGVKHDRMMKALEAALKELQDDRN